MLMTGDLHLDHYTTILTREFYRFYIEWCDKMKINRRETEDWLPRRINSEVMAGLKSKGGNGQSRFYELPTLADARLSFDEAVGYKTEWEE